MELISLAEKYVTDKLDHGYLPHYKDHLPSRQEQFSLLEIGIHLGGSIRMWRDYFTHAEIYGVDNKPECMIENEDRIHTFCGDAMDPNFWQGIEIPNLQVIIDDCDHFYQQTLATFDILWPRLPTGGWYVIEDLAVQWYSQYGGNENGSPLIRMLEQFMHQTLRVVKGKYEMHVYEQMVFLRKP